ncbi:MerR family transcriptional regulator [Streptomyces natalensis]|uniref:MerR family transcriptional regulator n=1 Tax=Streptomyces natalensis TaxID=68242 RepID=UPI0005C8ED26|nr:MerR family transcriptional regulator [Streptomyces natalensis]
MRIGEAAAAAGLTPRTVRYYEQQGLLTARRTTSGHREYDAEDIRRLKAVRELRDAGLTVGDVRAFAHLLATLPADGMPEVIPKHPGAARCAVAEAVARRRLADLDARIARLSQLRGRLAARLGEPGAAPEDTAPAAAARAGADSGPIFWLDAAPAPEPGDAAPDGTPP